MKHLTLLAIAFAVVACDASKPELERTLAKTEQISAEKDSLLKDVMATSKFIADVNSELAHVRRLGNGRLAASQPGEMENNLSMDQRRAQVVEQVRAITERINASEGRLSASRKRVGELAGKDSAMTVQLASYDSTIAAFKSIVDNQRAEIASLSERVRLLDLDIGVLRTSNVALVSEKTQLTDDNVKLASERNTAYYIIGNRDALLRRHVIEQTGGTLGLGKVQVPARALSPVDFTPIDKTQVMEITLPKANTAYRIVSRQDVAALETAPDKHGHVMGTLKIKDPEAFWSASKFLIVIEQ